MVTASNYNPQECKGIYIFIHALIPYEHPSKTALLISWQSYPFYIGRKNPQDYSIITTCIRRSSSERTACILIRSHVIDMVLSGSWFGQISWQYSFSLITEVWQESLGCDRLWEKILIGYRTSMCKRFHRFLFVLHDQNSSFRDINRRCSFSVFLVFSLGWSPCFAAFTLRFAISRKQTNDSPQQHNRTPYHRETDISFVLGAMARLI